MRMLSRRPNRPPERGGARHPGALWLVLRLLVIAGITGAGSAAWAQRTDFGGGYGGGLGGFRGEPYPSDRERRFPTYPVEQRRRYFPPVWREGPYRPSGGEVYLPEGPDPGQDGPRRPPRHHPPRPEPPRHIGQGRPPVLPPVVEEEPPPPPAPEPTRIRRHPTPVLAHKPTIPEKPARLVLPSKPVPLPARTTVPVRKPVAPVLAGRPPAVLATDQSFVPDEVLFELRPNAPAQAAAAIGRQYRLAPIRQDRLDLLGVTIVRARILDGRTPAEVARALSADGRVASAQSNGKFRLQEDPAASPAPPAAPAGLQWAADKMQLATLHRLSDGKDVLVAVIDSGIDTTHPELAGSAVTLVDLLGGPFKPHSHGTSMAGAILSHGHLVGVAPAVRILELRSFDAEGAGAGAEGTSEHIARALDAAYKGSAKIVNLSFAGPADPLLTRMFAALRLKGIVAIAAAGNGGPGSPPLYPAADPNVIAVTASDAGGGPYAAATRGSYICVAAPGVDVLEPVPGSSYQLTSGTSVAAAHVSGLVALLLARDPTLTPDAIRKLLVDTAQKGGDAQAAEAFGSGLVDGYRALQALAPKPGPDKLSNAPPGT